MFHVYMSMLSKMRPYLFNVYLNVIAPPLSLPPHPTPPKIPRQKCVKNGSGKFPASKYMYIYIYKYLMYGMVWYVITIN